MLPRDKNIFEGGWFRFVGAGDIKLTPLLEKSFSVILQLSTRRFVGLWGRRDDGIAVISISRPRCKFETLRTARTLTPLLFSLPDTIERRLRLQLLEWRQHRSTSYKIETCPNLLSLHHWFFQLAHNPITVMSIINTEHAFGLKLWWDELKENMAHVFDDGVKLQTLRHVPSTRF